jgi:AraC-like DNA-binding protein
MLDTNIEKIDILKVLQQISSNLGGEYFEDIGEAMMRLNNENGKGIIRAFEFFGGISCLAYDIEFKEEQVFTIQEIEDRHLYFNYILDGFFSFKIGEKGEYTKVTKNQNVIVKANPEYVTYVSLPNNVQLRYLAINIDANCTNIRFENPILLLRKNLQDNFRLEKENMFHAHFGNFSLNVVQAIEEFYNLKATGAVKRILSETIILKVLGYQLEEYEQSLKDEKLNGLQKTDFEKLQRTVQYIENNLSKKHTIRSLTSMSGMTEKQLQRSFKKVFRYTPIQFVNELRLEKSRELLLKSDLNSKEITYKLGFSNTSYFTLLFKKKFGLTPKSYQLAYKT